MARDIERQKASAKIPPEQAAEKAQSEETPATEATLPLGRAIAILTANGEAPGLLQEIHNLQINFAGGEISEDMAALLLEAAVSHHLPGILDDQRAWAQELARIAGV